MAEPIRRFAHGRPARPQAYQPRTGASPRARGRPGRAFARSRSSAADGGGRGALVVLRACSDTAAGQLLSRRAALQCRRRGRTAGDAAGAVAASAALDDGVAAAGRWHGSGRCGGGCGVRRLELLRKPLAPTFPSSTRCRVLRACSRRRIWATRSRRALLALVLGAIGAFVLSRSLARYHDALAMSLPVALSHTAQAVLWRRVVAVVAAGRFAADRRAAAAPPVR